VLKGIERALDQLEPVEQSATASAVVVADDADNDMAGMTHVFAFAAHHDNAAEPSTRPRGARVEVLGVGRYVVTPRRATFVDRAELVEWLQRGMRDQLGTMPATLRAFMK
jgi:hypothetical protein